METVADYFGGFKVAVDGDCSHEIKRCLLLGRRAVSNHSVPCPGLLVVSPDVGLPTGSSWLKCKTLSILRKTRLAVHQ